MKKHLAALAALSALALPASAQASAFITTGTPTDIPTNNDFLTNLNGLGLTSYATLTSITLDQDHYITFEFLGSESGYSDTFWAQSLDGLISSTETLSFENHFGLPQLIGGGVFSAGDISALLGFLTDGTSDIGEDSPVGHDGFAVFLPRDYQGGALDTLYFGYDDQPGPDDNHDDFIVKATLGAVPEPSTWLLMIMGFGAIGFGMRKSKQTQRIRFNFA